MKIQTKTRACRKCGITFETKSDIVLCDRCCEVARKRINMEQTIISLTNALKAIANMKITETTNKEEVLALCIGIAKIELQKRN